MFSKTRNAPKNIPYLFAGSLESAYSLNWGAREIWGQDLGTFMISRPI